MLRRIGEHGWGRIAGVALITAAVGALQVAVDAGHVKRVLVPAPSDIASELVDIFLANDLWPPLLHTLYLLFSAYLIASALAIVMGIAMGRYDAIYKLFEPLVELLRPLPKPALLPPLILFLGLGDAMKMFIVGLAVFFPVLINTVQGVRGIDPVLVNTARTFGVGQFDTMRKVVLPASLPFILTGLRIAIGLALILVVVAEMLAGTGGIGYLILDMQRTFQVREMYAWLIILAVLGYLLNRIFVAIERALLHWT